MNSMTPSCTEPERGRIVRPRKDAHEGGWRRWIPAIEMLRCYEVIWLRHDIMAGLVLTTMLIPAPIIPLLVFALSGPSRILVLGPDSSLAVIRIAPASCGTYGVPPIHTELVAKEHSYWLQACCAIACEARISAINTASVSARRDGRRFTLT
jgi:hypothetical protein